ncbi:MAG TPA: transketolase C-terminal domain-containing protein [Candidatus Bathyarchaeia archaeon]|nr:transketolase C-terminal domain-containing protein [Candidatus Bathyarchaeia archaeon]
MKKTFMTGNYAAAYAVKLADVKMVAAYPITPQTSVVEKISEFVASGEMQAEYIKVESEHSAMSCCIGASVAGVRTFTATSSQGLLYMHEMLHWASGSRLPIVMVNVNRALAPPWTIWTDQNDSISQRDTGWMQFYCEDNQDILDTLLQAYKIAEDQRVLLPAMVCYDGFELSHTSMPVEVPDKRDVDSFLPPYNTANALIDLEHPTTVGSLVNPDLYMEFRFLIQEAMENAKHVAEEVAEDYSWRFNRNYSGQVECYKCKGAEVVIVSMGALSSEVKEAVDRLRKEKLAVGAVKIKLFRPFPKEKIREFGSRLKAFVIVDRDISFGMEGALFTEVKSSLYSLDEKPKVLGFVAGLGGRDIRVRDIVKMVRKAYDAVANSKKFPDEEWIGLRGEKP